MKLLTAQSQRGSRLVRRRRLSVSKQNQTYRLTFVREIVCHNIAQVRITNATATRFHQQQSDPGFLVRTHLKWGEKRDN